MKRWLLLLLLAGCSSAGKDDESPASVEAEMTAPGLTARPDRFEAVLEAVGRPAWKERVTRIQFTWHHIGKGLKRSYEWDLLADQVTATAGEKTETFPSGGPGELHASFVNDSYWFLFELMAAEDGSLKRTLGPVQADGFRGKLPEMLTVDVRYPENEGYTGGDRYILYLDAQNLPRAWSFHKGGTWEPTLVTTREKHVRAHGVALPTEFRTADGAVFIRIENVRINGEALP
ncbi:MAG: hypothetical protein AAGD14_19010 [Planctomycetota bacterium]